MSILKKIVNKLKNKFFRKKEKAILIIEPGGIGDYLFCRPYFKYLKECEKYKNMKFIYLAKDVYKDFTETFDRQYFDEIISYNGNKFLNNKHYKKYILSEINKYKIATLINLRCVDTAKEQDWKPRLQIIKSVNAKEKITDIINNEGYKFKHEKLYTKIIKTNTKTDFELERRRKFFENLTGIEIPPNDINLSYEILEPDTNYIAISIIALDKRRKYKDEYWKTILDNITQNCDLNTKLLFLGAPNDKKAIDKLINTLEAPDKCLNFAGSVNISQLPNLLSKCKFLLSVETGTVHIAHAVNLKTICISNGSFYNRFQPYENIDYIYPQEFLKELNSSKSGLEKFYGYNKYSTDSINPQDVINTLQKYL